MTENQRRRFEGRIQANPLDWNDAQAEKSSTAGAAKGGNTSDNGSQASSVLTEERIDELGRTYDIQAFRDLEYRSGLGCEMTWGEKERYQQMLGFARAIEAEVLAQAGVRAEPAEPLTIALGQGLIEIGEGHHGEERLPAILFGRNGAGAVGVETEGDRIMGPGECIVAVTFENYQSLDVVVEKFGELRARIWPDAPHSQLSYGAAPHYRGYAHLGIGAYVINHSAAGEPPELAISIATDAQKAGRVVGDLRDNEPGEMVQPKDIAVRLRFENVAGLDALEQQLRFVRSEHFAQSSTADKASEVRAALERDAARYHQMKENDFTAEYCAYIGDCLNERETVDLDVILDGAAMAAAPSTADSGNTSALGEGAAE